MVIIARYSFRTSRRPYCWGIWNNTHTYNATNVNCDANIILSNTKESFKIIHHGVKLSFTNCQFRQMHSLKFGYFEVKAIFRFKLYYSELCTLLQAIIFTTHESGAHRLHNTCEHTRNVCAYEFRRRAYTSVWRNTLPENIKETGSLFK